MKVVGLKRLELLGYTHWRKPRDPMSIFLHFLYRLPSFPLPSLPRIKLDRMTERQAALTA